MGRGKRWESSLPLFHLPIVSRALSVSFSPVSIGHKREFKQQGRQGLRKRHLESELALSQTLLR